MNGTPPSVNFSIVAVANAKIVSSPLSHKILESKSLSATRFCSLTSPAVLIFFSAA